MRLPWRSISVPPTARSSITGSRITQAGRVREYAAVRGWMVLGEAEWLEIRKALPDLPERTLRRAGIAVAQPWRGIVQRSFEELETSLTEIGFIYANRPELRSYCRSEVIAAKDRARWASKRRAEKAEMVDWMLVWLADPAMFPAWISARRRAMSRSRGAERATPAVWTNTE